MNTFRISNINFRANVYIFLAVAIFVFSVWLRAGWPSFLIPAAGYDDQLFMKLADSIQRGNWLGPYDHLTLAKGAFYSIFIAVVSAVSIPLKLAEHILYLVGALAFALAVGRIYASRNLFLILFAVLAFAPIMWGSDLARIIREAVYVGLTLLVFACFMAAFLDATERSRGWPPRWAWAVLLGLSSGAFWLTREEGIWLLPTLVLVCLALVCRARLNSGRWLSMTRETGLNAARALLVFGAIVTAVNITNYVRYGVYLNNEFRAGGFAKAYGAITRVKPESWNRYVVFPKDVRAKVYAVSPATKELAPFFEGDAAKVWAEIGCKQHTNVPCDEVSSGWFMWALRQSAVRMGHHATATEARDYYSRIGFEIDEACDLGKLNCIGPRSTLVPPLRTHYLMDWIAPAQRLLAMGANIGPPYIGVPKSHGNAENQRPIREFTGAEVDLGTGQFDPSDQARAIKSKAYEKKRSILMGIANIHLYTTTIGGPVALAMILLLGWRWVFRLEGMIALALFTAVASRTALLGFLEVTSIPSVNTLYFAPAYPLLLAFVVTTLWLGLTDVGRILKNKRAVRAGK